MPVCNGGIRRIAASSVAVRIAVLSAAAADILPARVHLPADFGEDLPKRSMSEARRRYGHPLINREGRGNERETRNVRRLRTMEP